MRASPDRRLTLPVLLVACAACAAAQSLLSSSSGGLNIRNTDMAVFEAGEDRKDLPCTAVESKPVLGFDLRYHAGFEVSVPMKELAGSENLLTILFRVTPVDPVGDPVFLTHRFRVPSIEDDAKGDALLQGAFDIGEGKFKVDWLMRDRTERVCASSWETLAHLPVKDKQIALALEPGAIQPSDREQFKEEPPVVRTPEDSPLSVKVLVNFAPQNSHSATLQPFDTNALVAILRNISRDPRITRFNLVAFNLQEQRVLYRQDNADRIDFPALGEAISSINPGTVDASKLGVKNGDTEFLTHLIVEETGKSTPPDALVFAGPKAMLEENVPQESLRQVGELSYPVFYMNYNLYPQSTPWNDTISKAVKFFKGYEYTISKPRDLWFAVTEMVSRISKSKQVRRGNTSPTE